MTSGAAGASKKKPARDAEDLKGPLKAFLKGKRLHESKVRDLIVDTFLASDGHLGLDVLLEKVRRKNPSVGFATVYRTMKLLVEAGLAHERDFGTRAAVYERAHGRDHHDHLICERCGQVVEFVDPQIERLQERVATHHGFEVRWHRHEMFGVCSACKGAAV